MTARVLPFARKRPTLRPASKPTILNEPSKGKITISLNGPIGDETATLMTIVNDDLIEIVGESHYQDALAAVGTRSVGDATV